VVFPVTQVESRNIEGEGMQSQYHHTLVCLGMKPVKCIMTCPGMPGIDVRPLDGNPNHFFDIR